MTRNILYLLLLICVISQTFSQNDLDNHIGNTTPPDEDPQNSYHQVPQAQAPNSSQQTPPPQPQNPSSTNVQPNQGQPQNGQPGQGTAGSSSSSQAQQPQNTSSSSSSQSNSSTNVPVYSGSEHQPQQNHTSYSEWPPRNHEPQTNVHIIVNSHLDLGWIYTLDKYYTGTKTQEGGCVKCIFENVVKSLSHDSMRKYTLAEIGFLAKWFRDPTAQGVEEFTKFVKNGQIEIINGGWSANDEACAYYEDIIDNFVVGMRWAKDNLGVDVVNGWQIDSFGHSKAHAALMAELGHQSLFIGRIDFQDWETRRKEKALEFNWKPGNANDDSIFTRLFHRHYSDTKYFIGDNFQCRSIFCQGELKDPGYVKVSKHIEEIKKQVKTKNVMLMVCDDFHLWKDSEKDYRGMTALIEHYNVKEAHLGYDVRISTLSEYISEIKKEKNTPAQLEDFPSKRDDFFPYIEYPLVAWTGYFSSRPNFKYNVRQFSQYLNGAKVLLGQYLLNNSAIEEPEFSKINAVLTLLEENLGVMQHHDGISATMKEEVRVDYERMMKAARDEADKVITELTKKLMEERHNDKVEPLKIHYQPMMDEANMKEFSMSNDEKLIQIYNPGQAENRLVKVIVPSDQYILLNESNAMIETDIMCVGLPKKCYMYIYDHFPAYSNKYYKIIKSDFAMGIDGTIISQITDLYIKSNLRLTVFSDFTTFNYTYCEEGGDLYDLGIATSQNYEKCIHDKLNIDYEYYTSLDKAQNPKESPSGAYIFRPKSPQKKVYSQVRSATIFRGKHLTIISIYRDQILSLIKFNHHDLKSGFSIESIIKPITPPGKEIVLVARSSNVKNEDSVWYTDANGYLIQQRKKDYRETFKLNTKLNVSSNYYPATAFAYTEDPKTNLRLTINNDRSQGMSSMFPGEMEFMIHRATNVDDKRGLGQPMREAGQTVRAEHWISYSKLGSNYKPMHRRIQYLYDRRPHVWFYKSATQGFTNPQPLAPAPLPNPESLDQVKLYIRSYAQKEYFLRFHNVDEEKEKTIKLYDDATKESMFLTELAGNKAAAIKVLKVEEMGLSTTKTRKEKSVNPFDPKAVHYQEPQSLASVTLKPNEQRTFLVTIQ